MVKIKRKVEMTQEEYAKYLIDKYGVSGFESDLLYSNIIDAPKQYKITFELNPILKKELPNGSFRNGKFTVEVEEEITEDTVIPKVLNIFKNTTNRIRNDEESHIRRNVSVKEIKENSKDYIENDRLYIMNDDLTMTLIWKNGKLVE